MRLLLWYCVVLYFGEVARPLPPTRVMLSDRHRRHPTHDAGSPVQSLRAGQTEIRTGDWAIEAVSRDHREARSPSRGSHRSETRHPGAGGGQIPRATRHHTMPCVFGAGRKGNRRRTGRYNLGTDRPGGDNGQCVFAAVGGALVVCCPSLIGNIDITRVVVEAARDGIRDPRTTLLGVLPGVCSSTVSQHARHKAGLCHSQIQRLPQGYRIYM